MLSIQDEQELSIATRVKDNHGCRPTKIDLFSSGQPVELNEFSVLDITVKAPIDVQDVSLSIGDYELNIEKFNDHTWRAIDINPFVNQMGVAVISLLVDDQIFESRPINIFASKLTYEKAGEYLRFLTREAEDIAALCFSASKLGSDGKSAQNDIFTRKLDSGITAVRFLIENSQRFIQDPIFNQQSETAIERYQNHTTVDKKGIDYLASNPHELTKSDPFHAQIKLQGRYFKIDNIAKQVTNRHFDTYENRVIHYFLNSFDAFLRNAKDQLHDSSGRTGDVISLNNRDFFSFERLLSDTGLTVKVHAKKIDKARHMVRQAKHLFNAKLPVNLTTNKPHYPEPTTRALMKGHYKLIFDFARRFYKAEEPEWAGADDLFGLRNLSKIYEIVSLYRLIGAVLSSGAELTGVSFISWHPNSNETKPVNEPFNYFTFSTKDGDEIELFYEPWVKPIRSKETNRLGLVDIAHKNTLFNGKPICWRPDFIIKKNGEHPEYHVFDAKYSRYDLVNDKTTGSLANCTQKYIMGIRIEDKLKQGCSNLLSTVSSMHIIHSDETRPEYFTHTKPLFNLDRTSDSTSISDIFGLPFTGSLAVSPAETKRLNKLIKIILSSTD